MYVCGVAGRGVLSSSGNKNHLCGQWLVPSNVTDIFKNSPKFIHKLYFIQKMV